MVWICALTGILFVLVSTSNTVPFPSVQIEPAIEEIVEVPSPVGWVLLIAAVVTALSVLYRRALRPAWRSLSAVHHLIEHQLDPTNGSDLFARIEEIKQVSLRAEHDSKVVRDRQNLFISQHDREHRALHREIEELKGSRNEE